MRAHDLRTTQSACLASCGSTPPCLRRMVGAKMNSESGLIVVVVLRVNFFFSL